MKIELSEAEMATILCEWASRLRIGDEQVDFNKATFYKLESGYSATLDWVDEEFK